MPRKARGAQASGLNITPLLDIVFLLIIFFLLVTNFSAAELPDLDPPDPDESQAKDRRAENRVVVNVIPEPSDPENVQKLRVGAQDVPAGEYSRLTKLLQQESDKVRIDLRADGSLPYTAIRPVMAAIAEAGIQRINMVAKVDKGAS